MLEFFVLIGRVIIDKLINFGLFTLKLVMLDLIIVLLDLKLQVMPLVCRLCILVNDVRFVPSSLLWYSMFCYCTITELSLRDNFSDTIGRNMGSIVFKH